MDADKDNLLPARPAIPEPSLFDSPSIAAGRVAARYAKVRYMQILQLLKQAGSDGLCIFEIAAALSTPDHQVFDHQISGRFGAMEKDLLIARSARTRIKPETGCKCSVYVITTLGLAAVNNLAAAEQVRAAGFTHKRFRNALVRAMVNDAVERCSEKKAFLHVWRNALVGITAEALSEWKKRNAAATLAKFEASKRRPSNAPQTPIEGASS